MKKQLTSHILNRPNYPLRHLKSLLYLSRGALKDNLQACRQLAENVNYDFLLLTAYI